MDPKIVFKASGIISVIIGILASLCLINVRLIFPGLILAILGFLSSGINIFLNEKYDFSNGRYSIGFIGMIFSSVPVLFIMYMAFSHR